MKRRLGIATSEALPYLVPDDQEFRLSLLRQGFEAVPAVWSRPDVPWAEFDAVLIRSTWDYYQHLREFRAWADHVGRVSRLWNPPHVVRWNSNKSYLLELEDRGVPIIPTVRLDRPNCIEETLARRGWSEAVLKPAVSAAAYRTYLVRPGHTETNEEHLAEILGSSEALLQPYLREVERGGEHSLLFFFGAFSHAIVKSPKLAEAPTIEEGSPYRPHPDELSLARGALEAAPGPLAYARADMVRDEAGEPRLMELEVIEPSLFFLSALGSGERFARGLGPFLDQHP